jgi:hypothetical protein
MMRGNPRRTFAALLALAAAAMLAACEKVTLPADQDGKVPDSKPGDLAKPDARVDGPRLDSPPAAKGWVISAGGTGWDAPTAPVVDSAGDLIVAGGFTGTATFGTTTLTAKGTQALFVAKLDPSGQYKWVVPLDGAFNIRAWAGLGVDGADNIYLSGSFSGTVSFGTISVTAKGDRDVFVAKLDSSGKVLWAANAGGPGTAPTARNTHAHNLAVDSAGNSTVVGEFQGTLGFGATSLTAKGASDGFVARLDPSGKFVWAVQVGSDSTSGEGAYGVAVDKSGNATIAGMISGAASFGSLNLTAKASFEIFLARLDSSGTFVWAVPGLTTVALQCGWSIPLVFLDGAGNSYLAAGAFYSGGTERPLVVKYTSSGTADWTWAATGPGANSNMLWNAVRSLLVDSAGALTIAGTFTGTKQIGAQSFTASGAMDMFLARLDSAGKLVSAEQLGGPGEEDGYLARDASGNLYVVGGFQQSIVLGGTTLASKGEMDIFVWKRPPL